jgi:deoxyribonuclease NucA/NucB
MRDRTGGGFGLATKVSGKFLLAGLLLVTATAYFGVGEVVDWAQGVIDDISSDDYAVAPGGKPLVKQCSSDQVLKQRKCGDVKILVLDATKMPYITRNIRVAWGEGKPFVLTRNSALQGTNRTKACGGFAYKFVANKGSCDEYPFATTDEGGNGARTEEVHLDEQRCQGGTISRGYQLAKIANGDTFLVVISNPSKIASQPWNGQEVKTGTC